MPRARVPEIENCPNLQFHFPTRRDCRYNSARNPADATHLCALLFGRGDEAGAGVERDRAPQLGKLDGPAHRGAISQVFAKLRGGELDPVLLYFTGHGSPGPHGDLNNNFYDLWGEEL